MPNLLALVRALHLAASLSLFGTLLFRAVIAPPVLARAPQPSATGLAARLARLASGSLAIALGAILPWLPLQAAAMSGAETLGDALSAVGPTLLSTNFG